MDNLPLVSFVICEHNTPIEYFREAISSVLNQSYKNIEIIIVDDKSSNDLDNEPLLKHSQITVYHNSENLGLAESRNVGILQAKGKYIAIMDTDDICHKDRIREQVMYMEKHNKVCCLGTYVRLFGDRNLIQKYNIKDTKYYQCCLFFNNYPTITNPSVLIRKEILDKYKITYWKELFSSEDYMMWVKLSEIGEIRILKKVLLSYRIRDGQMSQIYRTDGLGPNCIKIRKYQLSRLGAGNLSDSEFTLLCKDYASSDVDTVKYFSLLNKLLLMNKHANYYDCRMFLKRVNVQKKNKIYHIRFKYYHSLFKSLSKLDRLVMVKAIIIRPLNIFSKFYNLIRNK